MSAPRDQEERRIKGGAVTPVSRDQEEKRLTGAAIPTAATAARDAEEARIAAGK
jgi:hypothetical protein